MFLHALDDGHVLVRIPRCFAAWRVPAQHAQQLRRTQAQLYAPLVPFVLIPLAHGRMTMVLAAAFMAAGLWSAWRFFSLWRWLIDRAERVDYKYIPLRWYERQTVLAAILIFAAILFVTIKMATA